MDKMKNYRILAGIIVFGSIWGMLEAVIGNVSLTGVLKPVPTALLAGLFGLGLMAWTRRVYAQKGMQISMAVVAALLSMFGPIGSCIICSGLAIVFEGVVFELIFNRPTFNITARGNLKREDANTLVFLGIIAGYLIYVVGYIFTQILTPMVTSSAFHLSDLMANMPLMMGRGFFAAIFGGIALPIAVLAPQLNITLSNIRKEHYYAMATGVSVFCWILVIASFHLI